ncbi:MAG: ABC transporter transmembrane domain-containing protein, partial [Nitriliruptorales bacterium]
MSTTPSTTESPFAVVRRGLRLLAHFIREHPSAYALAATGAIAFTSAIVASAFVIGYVTEELIEPVLAGDAPLGDRLVVAVGLVLGVGLWKMIGIVIRRTAAGWLQFGAQTRLRKRIIAHELELPMSWYGQRAVGDLLSVSDNDARQATWVLAPLPFATGVVFLLFATVAVVLWTDLWLGLAALALLGTVVGLDIYGSWLTFEAMEEAQRRRGRVGDVAHESVDGALTVKALGRADLEVARFREGAESLRDQLVEVGRRWTFYRAITEGLPAVGIVVILFIGVVRIAVGALGPGELVRVVYLLALLAVPVRLVGYLTWEIAHSVAGWERVEEILSITDVIRYG